MPSIGQLLKDLWIQGHGGQVSLPLGQLLIHQLPEPVQATEAAAIAQLHQGLGAKPLEAAGAAGNMNVSHGRYRAQDPTAGRGASRTRATRVTCRGCGITS